MTTRAFLRDFMVAGGGAIGFGFLRNISFESSSRFPKESLHFVAGTCIG